MVLPTGALGGKSCPFGPLPPLVNIPLAQKPVLSMAVQWRVWGTRCQHSRGICDQALKTE